MVFLNKYFELPKNFGLEGGYFIFLCNLGKLAKQGGGGYPQAVPKVINLQGMLELPEILVLIEKLPPRSYTKKEEGFKKRIQKVSHVTVEWSGLLTYLRLKHYGYRLTVLRNEVSDTDCSSRD